MGGAVNLGFVILPQYQLFLCAVGPLIAVAMWFVVDRTRWGRVVRAATQDREMLAALGVNVPMVYAAVFTIGSALAGVGGALAAPRIALVPGMDATIINECFIIVIIGGLGNMWGSFLGALAFGFVVQFGTVLAPNWQDVLPYLLMLVVLIVRPWGLLGRPETESGALSMPQAPPPDRLGDRRPAAGAAAAGRQPLCRRPHHRGADLRAVRAQPQRADRLHRQHLVRPCRLLRDRRLCLRHPAHHLRLAAGCSPCRRRWCWPGWWPRWSDTSACG